MKKVLCLLLVLEMLFLCSACKPHGKSSDITWEIKDGVLTVEGEGSIGNFCTDWHGIYSGACYDSSTIPWYGLDYHTLVLGEGITYVSDHAFVDSASLKKVIIQGKKVEICRGAFRNCSNLQEIENSERIVSMGEGAFENCTSLHSIKLGAQFYFVLPTISYALENKLAPCFSGCSSLESIEIDEDNTLFASRDGVVYTDDMDTLIYYPVGKQEKTFVIPETVETVYKRAFTKVKYLEEITLTGCKVTKEAFYDCPVLKTVVVGDDVTIQASFFERCSALESFRVGDDHPRYSVMDGVLYVSNSVSADEKLSLVCYPSGKKEKSFTIPKEVAQIQQNAFCGNGYLENVDFEGEGMNVISPGVFRECTSLRTVTLSESITTIGEDAFHGCTSLKNVTLPENITTIGKDAFHDCTSLENVTLPESITTIGESAFAYCTSLESITLPESVTTLGAWAFSYCKSLKSIRIPGSISTIESNTFCGCAQLRAVEISEGVDKIGHDVFRECELLGTVTIPRSVTEISKYTFDTKTDYPTIICPKDSAAEKFAKSYGVPYIIQ